MKNIVKYSKGLALVLALTFVGCGDDFLKYQQYGPGDSESFWKTESDLRKGLDAFYEYTSIEECTGRGTYWYENCSDDMLTGRSYAVIDRIKNFQIGASDHTFHTTWIQMTRLITKATDMLRYAPKIEGISEELKNNAVGQGYFFRAYGYLWLCPWYGDNRSGGIPIITEETTVDELDAPRPAKVTDNYDMIIADMREAGKLLPSWSAIEGTADEGRPHKTAAWAFAARAALYAAEYDAAKYFPIVIEMCDNIIKLTGADKRELHTMGANPGTSYGLVPSHFSDLFRKENNFSKEYIYSIFGSGELGNGPKFHGMSFENGGFGGYNTWGYFTPTVELYESFETGDTRRDATILAPGQKIIHPDGSGSLEGRKIWLGVPSNAPERTAEGITLGATINTGVTYLLNRKMHSIFEIPGGFGKDYSTSGDGLQNNLGVVVMRYADVLLMKAEALIWSQGEGNAEAAGLLNQIRKRAGLPENSTATKAALKAERRHELVFEFLPSRHVDLVRWGDAQAAYAKPLHGYVPKFKTVDGDPWVFDPDAPGAKVEQVPGRTFDPIKNHVFPIHTNIIAKSKGILKQSEGY